MKAHRQQMGMTLIQSLMVIAISAVLGVLGTVTYRAIVDQAYALKVAEHLESQMDYLIDQSYVDYEDMQDTLYKGQIDPAYPLGDGDYLDDLIATGKLPILPLEGFNDQNSLTWAIRAPNVGGQKLYYIHISSDDTRDGQLINEALSMANISSDYVDLVNPDVPETTSGCLQGELETLLVERRIITRHELELAVHYARFTGNTIGEAIVALELADELDVVRVMGEVVGEISRVQAEFPVTVQQLQKLSEQGLQLSARVSYERQQVVVDQYQERLIVATSNILDAHALDATRRFFASEGHKVTYVGTSHLEVSLLQQRCFGTGDGLREKIYAQFADQDSLTSQIHTVISQIVEMAVLEQASDIFFSLNREDEVNFVYFKCHKIKSFRLAVPRTCMESLHRAIKVDAGMDSGRKFGHQDGSMTVRIIKNRYRINLRVSAISTISGEQITMRIQALRRSRARLEDLGFQPEHASIILSTVHKKEGLVVLSGATGSGKTTTLYTLLDAFNVDEHNIITMEDPVEIRRRGINQIQINDAAGQSFRSSIRACLRQAPDIILIGEVRDQETAERAVEAANTGHMVFCTIHANSVAGVPNRLKELGVSRIQSFVENMALAIHQSLDATPQGTELRYELGGYALGGVHVSH